MVELTPTTGIIISATPTVGMNLACLEHYCWVSGYVLRLVLTGKSTGHTEGITGRQ